MLTNLRSLFSLSQILIALGPTIVSAFSIQFPAPRTLLSLQAKKSSLVSDPYGPSPDLQVNNIEEIDADDVPELQEIMRASDLPTPIPHQPWRKGDLAGCEAPIAVEWRREAEDIIYKAAELVGGEVLDVTWFLTAVLITIDPDVLPENYMFESASTVINVKEPRDPVFFDPADPNPEPIWDDEDDVLYQRQTPEEMAEAKDRLARTYVPKDKDDDSEEDHIPDSDPRKDDRTLYMNEETRSEVAIKVTDEAQLREAENEQPIDVDTIRINTAAISIIADAILKALKEEEDRLQILTRHEVVLSSPGPPDVIETQRQFDAYRGSRVLVETKDPFDSNRTLLGKIVDRNSMDLILNQKGRMVTVPLNFVKCVRLPPSKVAA
jgi:ribosome maturation factor RimP